MCLLTQVCVVSASIVQLVFVNDNPELTRFLHNVLCFFNPLYPLMGCLNCITKVMFWNLILSTTVIICMRTLKYIHHESAPKPGTVCVQYNCAMVFWTMSEGPERLNSSAKLSRTVKVG